MSVKVLIVDDNEMYRSAFRRNLMLQDYDVFEADNADEALKQIEEQQPDIVVTDLSMRTPTEGLELIKSVKQADPLMPIVMISAVGTFEEGSLAKELGAERVLMKQRIDEHIDELYAAIDKAKQRGTQLRAMRREVEKVAGDPENASKDQVARVREIIASPGQHPVILAEAYDALASVTVQEVRQSIEAEISGADAQLMQKADARLKESMPEMDKFAPETVKELQTAEYFFQRQGGDNPASRNDFSRNIGFSYCFAVENEAKVRLRKKLQKFLSDSNSVKIIRSLLDPKTQQLDLFYHQYLLRLEQTISFDFTVDNVRQVFQRILEHESRYKPDGLKALGIMIVCFGRDYTVKTFRSQVKVSNPLGLKAFAKDEEALRFAHLLVSLQHYRNPYIHPEISEMEKVSKIRETAIQCLREISRIS